MINIWNLLSLNVFSKNIKNKKFIFFKNLNIFHDFFNKRKKSKIFKEHFQNKQSNCLSKNEDIKYQNKKFDSLSLKDEDIKEIIEILRTSFSSNSDYSIEISSLRMD